MRPIIRSTFTRFYALLCFNCSLISGRLKYEYSVISVFVDLPPANTRITTLDLSWPTGVRSVYSWEYSSSCCCAKGSNKPLAGKQMLRRGMFLFLAHHFTCGATFLFLTPDSSTTTSSSFSFFASS